MCWLRKMKRLRGFSVPIVLALTLDLPLGFLLVSPTSCLKNKDRMKGTHKKKYVPFSTPRNLYHIGEIKKPSTSTSLSVSGYL